MTIRNLPPLNALKAFDAAARHGGYRAAADEMQVTHTVIGRHVRNLESILDVELFEQDTRGVRLTKAGILYARRINIAFKEISAATDELNQQNSTNVLRILVVPGFGTKWLAQRMHLLSEKFNHLTIVVEPAMEFSAVIKGQADFGIGFGDHNEFIGDLELFHRPEVYPVCSPLYAEQNGPFNSPETLLDADRLNEDFGEWWQDWFEANGINAPMDSTQLVYSTASQAVDAAIENQGIALANNLLVTPDLESGRLLRLPLPPFDGGAYWTIWQDASAKTTSAQEVAQWLQNEVFEFESSCQSNSPVKRMSS